MAVNCGVSFGLCAMRVTQLDELGNAVGGAGTGYVSDKAVSISVSPNIETGNTFSRRNGCGCSLARFKGQDVFNWWEFQFEGGALEPEMMALMLGAETIMDGGDIVGLAFPSSLDCAEGAPAVALEFWTKHITGSGQDALHPYVHWVFPYTSWALGDNTAEEDFMASALTGFSRTNELWGGGPYGDGPPDGQDIREGGYWKTADPLPTADCAGITVTPGS
jgi:hypothetical protein